MVLDTQRVQQHLKEFDFETLFIEELGWDRHTSHLEVAVDGETFILNAVAEKRGMVVFTCSPLRNGEIPEYAVRRKIDRQVSKSVHEHIIVYINSQKTDQRWQWVKRELGRPAACREHHYHHSQPGDSLAQKLEAIAFTLQEEEGLTLVDVAGRTRTAFDVERVTRRFYDRFKGEHAKFLEFIKGIPDDEMQRWYASVMLNRLMFIYFIQKKGFLNNDTDYLRNKLAESKASGKNLFYKDFLCPLFFEGFAKKEEERSAKANRLLGTVPYLNGGIFQRHQIEELHGKSLEIADSAFEKLFAFFEEYHWHLDERPLRADNEINPDVLGYIFEKYINQKQMGAYYSKEDITGYISQNTVIPFLFDAAKKKCRIAFEGEHTVWRLLQSDPDRYIYDAVKKGVELPLPDEIAAGIDDVSGRTEWNKPAPSEYALPTEIWREVVARRKRYEEVRSKLENGEIQDINDFITYNLDIRQFARDVIENCEGPELLRAFWRSIQEITVLDPTCGSGAFLFAALNILEDLYEACLDRMEVFLDELEHSGTKRRPEKYSDFRNVLERISRHPNRPYFIFKSIIINNLYGVDIMEEAVEICKLRLFLKLVAQVERIENIEPLPDIDFNIRAGNTLVGFATYDDVNRALTSSLDFDNAMPRIEEKAEVVDRLFKMFRKQQTEVGGDVTPTDKLELRNRLKDLDDELNRYLAAEYGVPSENGAAHEDWLKSHKPFHWFVEFYGILKRGGFDAIIGNPPYVEYRKVVEEYIVRGYLTESCGNLYAYTWERCLRLVGKDGRIGMIVPVSSVCTTGYAPLRELLMASGTSIASNFNDRPSRLFDGLEHSRLSIILHQSQAKNSRTYSTPYNKWHAVERPYVFRSLSFVDTTGMDLDGIVAKIGSETEVSILRKFNKERGLIGKYTASSGQVPIYYTRKLSYFVQVLDFIPKILDERNRERKPSELKKLSFRRVSERNLFLAILNSNLFYWLITVYSDCRNLNRREIEMVRFDLDRATDQTVEQLCKLAADLMEDIAMNSKVLKMAYRDIGTLRIQCTYPRLSKGIIDRIDRVLAAHYGFTDEELDFIVNYDIKYRMGLGVLGDQD